MFFADVQVELESQRRKSALETRKIKSKADERSLQDLRDRAVRETDMTLKRELEGQVLELSASLKAEAETLASIEADFSRSENEQAASRRTRRQRQKSLLTQRQVALGQHPPGLGDDLVGTSVQLKSGRKPSKTKKRSKRKDKFQVKTSGRVGSIHAKTLDNGNEGSGSEVLGHNETDQNTTSAVAMTSPLSVAVGEAADVQPVRTLSRRQRSRSRRQSARKLEAGNAEE